MLVRKQGSELFEITEEEEIFSAFARNFLPFHRFFSSSVEAVVGDSPASPAAYAPPLFAQVVIDIPATAEPE